MIKLDFFSSKTMNLIKAVLKEEKNYAFLAKNGFCPCQRHDLIKLIWYKKTKIEKYLIDVAFVYRIQEKTQ